MPNLPPRPSRRESQICILVNLQTGHGQQPWVCAAHAPLAHPSLLPHHCSRGGLSSRRLQKSTRRRCLLTHSILSSSPTAALPTLVCNTTRTALPTLVCHLFPYALSFGFSPYRTQPAPRRSVPCQTTPSRLDQACPAETLKRAITCHAVPCRAMPCRVVPYRAMPCHAVPCRTMPSRAVSCRAISYRAVPCRVVPCRVAQCRAMPCRVMPYHAVSCRAMPCRVSCHAVPFRWCRGMPHQAPRRAMLRCAKASRRPPLE